MVISTAAPLVLFLLLILSFLDPNHGAGDTLALNRALNMDETLVSKNGRFEIGFFNLSNSPNRYLALKYKNSAPDMVWIANRQNPITYTTFSLNLSTVGGLAIYGNGALVQQLWKPSTGNPVSVQLLDTGNLVVRDLTNASILWQSFDFPSDSLLPSMKVGLNLKTNENRNLSAWKNADDPSVGDVFYVLRQGQSGSFELYLMSPNGTIYYRPGPWNGVRFSGNLGLQATSLAGSFKYNFAITSEEVSYSYEATAGDTTIARLVAMPEGVVIREVWDYPTQAWKKLWTRPSETCDVYNKCGPNGVCENEICGCLPGFDPVQNRDLTGSQKECRRREKLPCGEQLVMFVEMKGMKLADTANATVNRKMSLEGCKAACASDCGCTAYALDNSTGTGIGCIMWYGDLIDVRKMGGTDLDVIFLKSSGIPTTDVPKDEGGGKALSTGAIIGIVLGILAGFILLVLLILIYIKFCCKGAPGNDGPGTVKTDVPIPAYRQ